MQPVSLHEPAAPVLTRPIAPFCRTERKRAHTAAVYYSECFVRGIEPAVADEAAEAAQGKYDKWWVQATVQPEKALRWSKSSSHADPTNSDSAPTSIDESSCTQNVFRGGNDGINHSQTSRPGSPVIGGIKPEATDDAASVVSANVVSVTDGSSKRYNDDESTIGQRPYKRHREHQRSESILFRDITTTVPAMITKEQRMKAKARLIDELTLSKGDTKSPKFIECLEFLEACYRSKHRDACGLPNPIQSSKSRSSSSPYVLEGNWLMLSKPTYDECKGRTANGSFLYSLGRMAFDMFKPTHLECSIQAVFNHVRTMDAKNPERPLHVPRKLMKEIKTGEVILRTYDIVVAFTIEPGQNRRGMKMEASEGGEYVVPRPIKGILTNQGYAIPDPNVQNRLSVWFSGGLLEVQDEPQDLEEWKKIFDTSSAPNRELREYANVLAAKILLGASLPETLERDGTMSFCLNRPIGGHGSAFCDLTYLDESLRIMRGHHGSVYVCSLVPEPNFV